MARAFERIKEALLKSKEGDKNWEKKVNETIKKFEKEGKTPTAAIKAAAMELNTETSIQKKVSGVFLKEFSGFDKKRRMNVIIGEEVVSICGSFDDLPAKPAKITLTNIEKIKYLMSGDVEMNTTEKSKIEVSKISADELFGLAKDIAEIEDEKWALIRGELIDVVCWNKEGVIVTPNGINLKLNFRSGEIRSGFFLSEIETLRGLMPSPEDLDELDKCIESQDWDGMLSYTNDVCGERREVGMPGMEILIYGKILDNPWKDKQGNERIGKTLRLGAGGFVYALDILYENDTTPKSKKDNKEEVLEEPFEEVSEEGITEEEVQEIQEAVKVNAIETPEGDSAELKILSALESPLSPSELVAKVKLSPTEVAQKLNELMASGKVFLKEGKFTAKR